MPQRPSRAGAGPGWYHQPCEVYTAGGFSVLEQDVEGRMEQGKALAGGTVLGGPPSQVPRGRDGFVAPLTQPSPLLPSSSLLGQKPG